MFCSFIFMYDLPTKEHPYLRIACTGKVDAITCSPEGTLCAAGIKEKIYIWEVGKGDTAAVLPHILSFCMHCPSCVLCFGDCYMFQ